MAIAKNKIITFSAQIKDENDKPVQNTKLSIQYFDVLTNAWEILLKDVPVMDAVFKTSFAYVPIKTEITPLSTKINKIITAGGVPQFRLVSINLIDTKTINVLTYGGRISNDAKSQIITIDFGTLWFPSSKISLSLPADPTDGARLVALPILYVNQSEAIDALKKELEKSNAQIQILNAKLALNEKELFKRMQVEKTLLDKIATSGKELNLQIEKVAQLTKMTQEYEANLNQAIQQNKQLETTIQANVENIKELNLAIAEETSIVAQKDKQIAQIAVENSKLVDQIKEISTPVKDYVPAPQPINKVYTSIIDEIQMASNNNTGKQFQLTNVSLNLKTFVEHDEKGIRLQMINAQNSTNLNGATVSDIKIDIGTNTSPTQTGTIVPNLIGLTETAARKLVSSLRYQLNPVYQYTNKIPAGQSFKQAPKPGDPILANETITVIFAKI
jgi:PASTA domain